MEKNLSLKFSDIEDCDMCPLYGDECQGGVSSSPNGYIEPPCVRSNPNDTIDDYYNETIKESILFREKSRQIELKKMDKQYTSSRRRYLNSMVSYEQRQVRLAKEKVSDLEVSLERIKSHNAVSGVFNDDSLKYEDKDILYLEKLLEAAKNVMVEKEEILKKEKERIRNTRGYHRVGCIYRVLPPLGIKESCYGNYILFISPKTLQLWYGCKIILEENGVKNGLLYFIRLNNRWCLYKENLYMGYLDSTTNTDKEFKRFLNSLFYDVYDEVDVVVLPDFPNEGGKVFSMEYPICYRSIEDFKEAYKRVIG